MSTYSPQALIAQARDGHALDRAYLQAFIQDICTGQASEGQIAAFAMAVRLRGLSNRDTQCLTLAMRDSGMRLSRAALQSDRPLVDKHSTGGVGDAVSLLLAPVMAAQGYDVPMLSGRGLGHTGGTLDKLAAIPGYRFDANLDTLRNTLRSAGFAIVSAGDQLAPADRHLYAVRDVTSTVDSIPLVVASILSKKLSVELDALVFDVKFGNGALFPDFQLARALAMQLVDVASQAGVSARAWLTDMDQPLLPAIGNALELRLVMDILHGKQRCERFERVTEALCLELIDASAPASARRWSLTRALQNGEAAERFARMVYALGGPNDVFANSESWLPRASIQIDVLATESGQVESINARALGELVVDLGGGRRHANDSIDLAVGLDQLVAVGSAVNTGDLLARVHLQQAEQIAWAKQAVQASIRIGQPQKLPSVPRDVLRERIGPARQADFQSGTRHQ